VIAAQRVRRKRRKQGTGQSKPLTARQRAALKIAIRAAARVNRLRGGGATRKRRKRKSR
jgi:hypothetical protein